jgi:hypothetical protein
LEQDRGLIPARAIRLIALYLLLLAGLAGKPLGGLDPQDGRWLHAAGAAHHQAATGAPARILLARLSVQASPASAIDSDGAGSDDLGGGFAAFPAHRPDPSPSQYLWPLAHVRGLSAGHAFNARAPPSA